MCNKFISHKPIVIAHRGASGMAPENTRAAFLLARDIGADGIELDVHLTRDGHLVVIHDYTINRTARHSNGYPIVSEKYVKKFTLEQLQKYDYGIWFDEKYAGEKIMTLESVLDLMGPDVIVNIEIKTDSKNPYIDVTLALADFIRIRSETKSVENILVSSFHPMALKLFKKQTRGLNIATGLLYGTNKEVPWYLKHGWGNIISRSDIRQVYYHDLLNKKHLDKKPIIAWTVDDITVAKKLIDNGVMGITTNVPEKILPLIKQK